MSDEYANILAALRDIIPKIGNDRAKEEDGVDDDKASIRVLIHQSHAGAIIGKGGSKIKELRESSGTQIRVFATCAPGSTDRVVRLTGQSEQIVKVLNMIHELLAKIPAKGPIGPYDSMNYDPSFANEYGGLSPPGGMGNTIGGDRGGGPPIGAMDYNRARAAQLTACTLPTGAGALNAAMGATQRAMNMPSMAAYYGGAGYGYGAMGNTMGGGGVGGAMSAYVPPKGAESSTQQVTIPNELAGTIIGRGGERINQIRQESGAQVLLEPSTGGERVITISGTPSQIQMAQYLLQQCVRNSSAGRRYIEEQQAKACA